MEARPLGTHKRVLLLVPAKKALKRQQQALTTRWSMVEEWERGRSGSCPLRRSGGERGFSCTSDMLARLLQPAVLYLLNPMTSAALLFLRANCCSPTSFFSVLAPLLSSRG